MLYDFDNFIGFWVKGMPYIFIEGDTVEKCKRIYTPLIDKNIVIFDASNRKIDVESVADDFLTIDELYCLLPFEKENCELVRNCFLVDVGYKYIENLKSKNNYIEGKEVSAYYAEKGIERSISILPENIIITDPTTGYNKNIKLYVESLHIVQQTHRKVSHETLCIPFTPNFLPTKVVYTKESRAITEKITRNYKKTATTKEILESFYNTQHESEVWSTNKTVNPKYYEWFTKYTRNIRNPLYIDMGCGSGKDALLISKEIHASHTTCADVKDSRVADVKNNSNNSNYSFMLIHEDTPLDIPDDSIDVITLFHTIHHMRDAQSRLQDLHRVLKPGGLLIIKDHNVKTQTDADNVTFEHFVYSIGEGEATVNDEETYKDILPMFYYSADTVNQYLECIGFTKLYLNTYNNTTKTYNAVYKKK